MNFIDQFKSKSQIISRTSSTKVVRLRTANEGCSNQYRKAFVVPITELKKNAGLLPADDESSA